MDKVTPVSTKLDKDGAHDIDLPLSWSVRRLTQFVTNFAKKNNEILAEALGNSLKGIFATQNTHIAQLEEDVKTLRALLEVRMEEPR